MVVGYSFQFHTRDEVVPWWIIFFFLFYYYYYMKIELVDTPPSLWDRPKIGLGARPSLLRAHRL
jgi:hypothetical protein